MKTGVLVHGCNLNIENWRHVAWGDSPRQLGRIPQGVKVALQSNADMIIFGTGASEKAFRLGNSESSGRILAEAEYSLEYLRLNFESLVRFDVFSEMDAFASKEKIAETKALVLDMIALDLESKNTVEEIKNAGASFAAFGIEKVMLVSSPSHIVRCLRDAAEIFQNDPAFSTFCDNIHAIPSRTCYEGTTAADVVVIEPPHRPDRHVVPTHRRIQRMLTLQKLGHDDLVSLIEEFDDLLQKYEHRYFNG